MREQRELKLDEVLDELYHLRDENRLLQLDNEFLQRQKMPAKSDAAATQLKTNNYVMKLQTSASLTNT